MTGSNSDDWGTGRKTSAMLTALQGTQDLQIAGLFEDSVHCS